MDNKNDLTYAPLFLKTLIFILDYLSYVPLTYIVLYCFSMVLGLVAGSPFESVFIKTLLLTLGVKGGGVNLNGADIMYAFFIWWLVLGTFFKLLEKLLGATFNNIILLILLSITVIGTLSMAIETGSFFVPTILFGLFIVSFLIYYLLSKGSAKVQSLIR